MPTASSQASQRLLWMTSPCSPRLTGCILLRSVRHLFQLALLADLIHPATGLLGRTAICPVLTAVPCPRAPPARAFDHARMLLPLYRQERSPFQGGIFLLRHLTVPITRTVGDETPRNLSRATPSCHTPALCSHGRLATQGNRVSRSWEACSTHISGQVARWQTDDKAPSLRGLESILDHPRQTQSCARRGTLTCGPVLLINCSGVVDTKGDKLSGGIRLAALDWWTMRQHLHHWLMCGSFAI